MKNKYMPLLLIPLLLTNCQKNYLRYDVEYNDTGDFTILDGQGYQALVEQEINFLMLFSISQCAVCASAKEKLHDYMQNINPVKIYLLELTGTAENDSNIINLVHQKYADTDFDLLNKTSDDLQYSAPTIFLFLEGFLAGSGTEMLKFVKNNVNVYEFKTV